MVYNEDDGAPSLSGLTLQVGFIPDSGGSSGIVGSGVNELERQRLNLGRLRGADRGVGWGVGEGFLDNRSSNGCSTSDVSPSSTSYPDEDSASSCG